MLERAVLRLDSGEELRVEVVREDADRGEFVVRRTSDARPSNGDRDLIAVIDAHMARAKRHPAGTTDRLLEADRERPY